MSVSLSNDLFSWLQNVLAANCISPSHTFGPSSTSKEGLH